MKRWWIVAAVLILAAAGWGASRMLDEIVAPPLDAHVDWIYYFDDLPTMVATADAVVEGTVVEVGRGDLLQEGEGEIAEDHAYQSRRVIVRVDAVHFVRRGSPAAVGAEISISGIGSWDGGRATVYSGLDWEGPGDRGFYFVDRDDCEPAMFGILNHQARYLLDGDDLVGAREKDPLIRRLEKMSPDRLRSAIESAARAVRSGRAKPEAPPKTTCKAAR